MSVSSVIPKSGIWKSLAEIVHVNHCFNSTRFCFMHYMVLLLSMYIPRIVVTLFLSVMTFALKSTLYNINNTGFFNNSTSPLKTTKFT